MSQAKETMERRINAETLPKDPINAKTAEGDPILCQRKFFCRAVPELCDVTCKPRSSLLESRHQQDIVSRDILCVCVCVCTVVYV